jgi:PKD repeat protein
VAPRRAADDERLADHGPRGVGRRGERRYVHDHLARFVDSNGDGSCHSDIRAYEYQRIQPTAEFSASPAMAGSPVTFDAGPSKDQDPGDESQFAYAWSFGDGQTGSGRRPQRVYAQPGDYSVTLTVSDPMGLQDTVAGTISVAAGVAPGPVAPAGLPAEPADAGPSRSTPWRP